MVEAVEGGVVEVLEEECDGSWKVALLGGTGSCICGNVIKCWMNS